MKRKKFKIFVSYNFLAKNGRSTGSGNNTHYHTDRKYLSVSDIRELENRIATDNGYTKVAILSFQFI